MNLFKKTLVVLASLAFATGAFAATTNDSTSYNTLYVTDATLSNNDWHSNVTVQAGDQISFDLHYFLKEGVSATDMRFSLENLDGRAFNAGSTETVTGKVTASNLSQANGSVTMSIAENVRFQLYNVSWQKYPCQSVGCEESLVDSYSKVLTSGGMSIGNVSGDASHYAGNVIVTFKAVSNSVTTYDNCTVNGVTVAHGESRRFYSTTSVAYGQVCSAYDQVRTCNDGVMSGSDSYRYTSCTVDNDSDNGDVTTKSATNIDEDSARLNGEWDGDDNTEVWFAFEEGDSTPSCSDSSQRVGRQTVDDGDDFSKVIYGLDEGERYYFRACADDSEGDIMSGVTKSFKTDDEDDNDDLDVTTNSATSIDEDSARLNGEIDGEDDVDVWFAFSRTDSTPSCTSSSQEIKVSGSYDDGDDFSKVVTGLADDTRYYFRACAEGDHDVESGSIRSFTTDDDGGSTSNTDARVVTNVASSITTSSARLNSIVLGEGNAVCYFQYGRTASLGLTSPRVYVDLDNTGTCSSVRTGLSSNSNYYFRGVIEQDGNTYYGSTRTFTTNRTTTNTNPRPNGGNTTITIINQNETTGYADEIDIMKFVSAETDPRFDIETRATPGELVYYKVKVTNNTDKDLDDVVIIDRIPYYLELDDESALDDDNEKQIRWVTDIKRGETQTYITEMRVREDARIGDTIESYASAQTDDYSVNSNDVYIEVDDSFFVDEDEYGNQTGSIFGSGFFPNTLVGWGILLLLILAIAYFISRIMVARNENAKVIAELQQAKAARANG